MIDTPHVDRLVQQHILEHELRLKQVDTLLERARQLVPDAAGDAAKQLATAKAERDRLAGRVEEYKQLPAAQWSEAEFENKGPMIVWDTLAQQLEKLVERLEH